MSIVIGSTLNQCVVLANSTVTNTGSTVILGKAGGGDVALSPGTSVTGFPPGIFSGTLHVADSFASTAQTELTTLYTTLASATTTLDLTGQDLGGMVLGPGVYNFSSSASIANTGEVLTLNGAGTYIFKIGSTLTTASSSSVLLTNGAKSCQVFWQVGSSATLGTNSVFNGVIAAQISITVTTGVVIACGAVYARTGAVTLDTNTINWDTARISNCSCTGGDPHAVCIDGSRIDLYDAGFYRLFDNLSNDDRIIVNAEIRRKDKNHTDYYHQVWVKTQRKQIGFISPENSTNEYLLQFEPTEIKVINNTTKTFTRVKKWEQNYTTIDDDLYTFVCESNHNTVSLLKNGTNQPFNCSGLLAGNICPITSLTDKSPTEARTIIPNFYSHNSLFSASAHPHVITVQGNMMKVKDTTVRLLQWNTDHSIGIVNATIGTNGRMHKLFIHVQDLISDTIFHSQWRWSGINHWKLSCFQNEIPVPCNHIFEKQFQINSHSIIFVRVQGNASLSVSYKTPDSSVRGLLLGDTMQFKFLYNTYVIPIDTSLSLDPIPVRHTESFYEKIIEPHYIMVAE